MEPSITPSRSSHQHSDTPRTPHDEEREPMKAQSSFIAEIFKFAIMALLIVVPFRMFIAQPFIVQGASMDPTFHTGQYLIVDQLTYRFDAPKRGDVVIFKFPKDPSKYFIKRIMGLPNETVEVNGTKVIITAEDGTKIPLDEPYIQKENEKEDFVTLTLGSDEYFVMGDNRAESSDSRMWGPVPAENLIGKALIRLLPLSTIGLHPGEYHLPQEVDE